MTITLPVKLHHYHFDVYLDGVLTNYFCGLIRFIKQLGWLLAVVQSLLIIASRKHYTVDIVVAWYEG